MSIRDMAKRAADFTLASAGLIVLSPLIMVTALLIRWRLGSPVLFIQDRPGLNARLFRLVKFRTMAPLEPHSNGLTDADRLTAFGRILRSTSIDELPTLWNVVRGDMSLVGPRPLLPDYLPLYNSRQARRHEVRPGITGLAQVTGRNALDWPERLELDIQYVEKRTLRLDCAILLRTLVRVIRRDGITEPGQATMTRFSGRSDG